MNAFSLRFTSLVFLFLVAQIGCFDAFAQQKTTLIQDLNEPGKNPYQATVETVTSCSAVPIVGVCKVNFPPVPLGKRLVITYVAGGFTALANGRVVLSKNGDITTQSLHLPTPVSYNDNGFIFSSPVTFYIDAGEFPTIVMLAPSISTGTSSAVVGYLVAIQ